MLKAYSTQTRLCSKFVGQRWFRPIAKLIEHITTSQAYQSRHPRARAYLREAVSRLGWREVGGYYLLAVLRVSPIALYRVFPLRAVPRRFPGSP